ncbi:MAG TPA: hypothetical protein VGQ51_03880 [Puia sp.]|nr:hypothetical protein [Puia sp.]
MIFYLMAVNIHPCPCPTEPGLSIFEVAALAAILEAVLSFVVAINKMQEKRKEKED